MRIIKKKRNCRTAQRKRICAMGKNNKLLSYQHHIDKITREGGDNINSSNDEIKEASNSTTQILRQTDILAQALDASHVDFASNQDNQNETVKNINSKVKLTCDYCHCNFKKKVLLVNHMSTVHTQDEDTRRKCLPCSFCESYFMNKQRLSRHISQCHIDKKGNLTNIVKNTNNDISNIWDNLHALEKQPKLDILAQAIGESCLDFARPNVDRRLLNVSNKNGVRLFKCNSCSYTTTRLSYLNRHYNRKDHGAVKKYECDLCMTKFAFLFNLQAHIKTIHNPKYKLEPRKKENKNPINVNNVLENNAQSDNIAFNSSFMSLDISNTSIDDNVLEDIMKDIPEDKSPSNLSYIEHILNNKTISNTAEQSERISEPVNDYTAQDDNFTNQSLSKFDCPTVEISIDDNGVVHVQNNDNVRKLIDLNVTQALHGHDYISNYTEIENNYTFETKLISEPDTNYTAQDINFTDQSHSKVDCPGVEISIDDNGVVHVQNEENVSKLIDLNVTHALHGHDYIISNYTDIGNNNYTTETNINNQVSGNIETPVATTFCNISSENSVPIGGKSFVKEYFSTVQDKCIDKTLKTLEYTYHDKISTESHLSQIKRGNKFIVNADVVSNELPYLSILPMDPNDRYATENIQIVKNNDIPCENSTSVVYNINTITPRTGPNMLDQTNENSFQIIPNNLYNQVSINNDTPVVMDSYDITSEDSVSVNNDVDEARTIFPLDSNIVNADVSDPCELFYNNVLPMATDVIINNTDLLSTKYDDNGIDNTTGNGIVPTTTYENTLRTNEYSNILNLPKDCGDPTEIEHDEIDFTYDNFVSTMMDNDISAIEHEQIDRAGSRSYDVTNDSLVSTTNGKDCHQMQLYPVTVEGINNEQGASNFLHNGKELTVDNCIVDKNLPELCVNNEQINADNLSTLHSNGILTDNEVTEFINSTCANEIIPMNNRSDDSFNLINSFIENEMYSATETNDYSVNVNDDNFMQHINVVEINDNTRISSTIEDCMFSVPLNEVLVTERTTDVAALSEEVLQELSKNENVHTDESILQLMSEQRLNQLKKANYPYSCAICNSKFMTRWKAHEHTFLVHKRKDYTCDECGRTLHSRQAIVFHIKSHAEPKKVECKVCGKLLAPSSMSIHMRLHNGKRPFMCILCGKRFRTFSVKRTHIKTYHLGFKRKTKSSKNTTLIDMIDDINSAEDSDKIDPPQDILNSLNEYLKAETKNTSVSKKKEKQNVEYTCEICKNVYKNKGYLKLHQKLHTRPKCFVCDCGADFYTKRELSYHTYRLHNKHKILITWNNSCQNKNK